MTERDVSLEVGRLLSARSGHFCFESGHHGSLWLDLELLCLDPDRIRPLAEVLAAELSKHAIEAVCGPLVEGAFVALMVASALKVPFTYASPSAQRAKDGLFPVRYAIPRALRAAVRGRRIAIVNDVVNAGSAVRGTLADLRRWSAMPVAIGTLAVLGDAAGQLAAGSGMALESLAALPCEIWAPSECPQCARGIPLTDDAT